jgi:hypothetical protein
MDLIARVRAAAAQSELVRAVASLRRDGGRTFALSQLPLRPLCSDEIAQLESQGNSCSEWCRIRVVDGFDCRRVRHCSFHGEVLLGRFTGHVSLADGVKLPTGLHHSTLVNCVIGKEVLIRDVKLLANYVVGDDAILFNCGSVCCDARTSFGNGTPLVIGIESGGCEVPVYAEMDLDTAAATAQSRSRRQCLDPFKTAVADYTAQVTSSRGVIEQAAILRSTPTIRNTYVGPHAWIDGATQVAECTLLSNETEPTRVESGASVSNSLLQWGCRVASLAIVERCLLTEHSYVERHGKATNSVLGPNTGVAEGEVTACLLGAFVGFHHQALLIATVWPEGRGNVSYGANVGANHTGKAPDQEFWPGEGAFLGLGVNVKFPANFAQAPYTLFACGVTTLPQKLMFPFALINMASESHPGISPAYNEIIPAWMLTDNLYAIKRNELKFQARNQARRMHFDFRVFRPVIIDLMRDACRRLESIQTVKEAYTDREIDGLGKNYLLEHRRQQGLEAYRFFVRYYALLRLKEELEKARNNGDGRRPEELLEVSSADLIWEHARQILTGELGIADVQSGLIQLPDILERVARAVERSKGKDDERGARIIDDYSQTHVAAANDPFVLHVWKETHQLQIAVTELLSWLGSRRPPLSNSASPPLTLQAVSTG